MVMDGLPFLERTRPLGGSTSRTWAGDGSDSAGRQVRVQVLTDGAAVLPLATKPKLVEPFAGTLPV